MKPLTPRDKKFLIVLAVLVPLVLYVQFGRSSDSAAVIPMSSVQTDELRLKKLRRMWAAIPAREELQKKSREELLKREKGLIVAETAPQAQAQLLQIVRRVAQAQQPGIVFRGTEFAAPRNFGSAYGEVVMTVSVECGIEQIVNFLADLSNQPELVSVSDLQLSQVNSKQKTVPARITFTGIVPKKLVPERKEGAGL